MIKEWLQAERVTQRKNLDEINFVVEKPMVIDGSFLGCGTAFLPDVKHCFLPMAHCSVPAVPVRSAVPALACSNGDTGVSRMVGDATTAWALLLL